MSDLSQFKVYGIGIVAANKLLTSDVIEITPIEQVPFVDGELTDNLTEESVKGQDAVGGHYETSVTSSVTIQAKWLPSGNTNRYTSPDVRRGEYVIIYQFGDADKYYWMTLLQDTKLRKLETVIYGLSNTRDESQKGSADNTYYFEWSTHKKLLHIHTSKSDGEPYTYDIQLNTKDGQFMIQDDVGNYICLDSANTRIQVENADGTFYDADQKNLKVYAPENISMEAGNNVSIKAGNNVSTDAGNEINDKASTIQTKADTTTNDVIMSTFTGSTNVAVDMKTMNFSSGEGGGGFIVTSDGIFTGHVTVQKLTSIEDIDAPNVD